MNLFVPGICFVIAIVVALACARRYGSWYSPIGIFAVVWLLSVGTFFLNIVRYVDIGEGTWAIIGASGLFFCFGCLAAHLTERRRSARSDVGLRDQRQARRIERALMILIPLGLIGFAYYLYIVATSLGLDAYLRSAYEVRGLQATDEFRAAFKWPRFLNYLNISNVAFGTYYLTVFGAKGRGRAVLLGTLLAFATTLLSAERTFPFAAVIWGFFVHEFALNEARIRMRGVLRVVVVFGLLLGLFIGIAQWLGKTVENYRDADRELLLDEQYRPLAMPYIYLTANFPAFHQFIRHNPGGETVGKYTLLPAMKVVQSTVDPRLDVPEEVGEYYLVPFEFNTYTYLAPFWSDFGLAGVLAIPFLMGLVFTVGFLRMRDRPTFRNVALGALASYVIVNSVFVNKMISTPTWEFAALILWLSAPWSRVAAILTDRVPDGAKRAQRSVTRI